MSNQEPVFNRFFPLYMILIFLLPLFIGLLSGYLHGNNVHELENIIQQKDEELQKLDAMLTEMIVGEKKISGFSVHDGGLWYGTNRIGQNTDNWEKSIQCNSCELVQTDFYSTIRDISPEVCPRCGHAEWTEVVARWTGELTGNPWEVLPFTPTPKENN